MTGSSSCFRSPPYSPRPSGWFFALGPHRDPEQRQSGDKAKAEDSRDRARAKAKVKARVRVRARLVTSKMETSRAAAVDGPAAASCS